MASCLGNRDYIWSEAPVAKEDNLILIRINRMDEESEDTLALTFWGVRVTLWIEIQEPSEKQKLAYFQMFTEGIKSFLDEVKVTVQH